MPSHGPRSSQPSYQESFTQGTESAVRQGRPIAFGSSELPKPTSADFKVTFLCLPTGPRFLAGFPRVRIFTPPPRRPRGCQPQVQPRCGVPPGFILAACPVITQERPFLGFFPGGFVGGCGVTWTPGVTKLGESDHRDGRKCVW